MYRDASALHRIRVTLCCCWLHHIRVTLCCCCCYIRVTLCGGCCSRPPDNVSPRRPFAAAVEPLYCCPCA